MLAKSDMAGCDGLKKKSGAAPLAVAVGGQEEAVYVLHLP